MKYEGEILITLDKEGAHVVSQAIADKLAKKNLSPSTVSGLEGCTARWLADSFVVGELVESPPDNAARRGNLFHSTMENLFALPKEERTKDAMKRAVTETLQHPDYVDLSRNRDVVTWLRDAVNGYYNMGGDPTKVDIAKITRKQTNKAGEEYEKTEDGIEIFVKGNLAGASRPTLGFVDQIIIDPTRDDGSVIVQDWKGLALDTLIPTPSGWRTMGELKRGDEVLGSKGTPVRVLNKSSVHNRPCYEIELNTSERVVCDNVHLWEVSYSNKHRSKDKTVVVNTETLAALYTDKDNFAFKISNPGSMEGKIIDFAIDPYLLGYWLGDGTSKSGSITVSDTDKEEVEAYLRDAWPSLITLKGVRSNTWDFRFPKPLAGLCRGGLHPNNSDNNRCKKCDLAGVLLRESTNVSLSSLLSQENVLNDKHIPESYFFASVDQRLRLLQGLMDSDGTWNRAHKHPVFGVINERLASDTASLVASFGVTPYLGSNATKKLSWKNDELYGKSFYSLEFSTFSLNPFRLERKRALADSYEATSKTIFRSTRKYISAIVEVPSVPTQCIEVDADDSLYQFGKHFTLTHNSGAKIKRWKSHTKSNDGYNEQRQQIIYSELLRQDGIKVSGARLIFPVARGVVNVELGDEALRERALADVERADKTLDALIETNTFEYKPDFLCHWCPLAKVCPQAGGSQGQFPKPYDKTMAAYESQPEIEVLTQGIEFL